MITSSQTRILRGQYIDCTADLVEWCGLLESHQKRLSGVPPCTPIARFNIGWYQVYGGIDWSLVSSVRNESLAAAAIHFITCIHQVGQDPLSYLPPSLIHEPKWSLDFKSLVYNSSRAIQQLFYQQRPMTSRGSRYNPKAACQYIAACATNVIQAITVEERPQAFHDAGQIMTEKL